MSTNMARRCAARVSTSEVEAGRMEKPSAGDIHCYSKGEDDRSCRARIKSLVSGRKPMEVRRSGSQASNKGSAEYFTGSVRIDPLFQASQPARAVAASVTFEPGARTAWHTHPLGQT